MPVNNNIIVNKTSVYDSHGEPHKNPPEHSIVCRFKQEMVLKTLVHNKEESTNKVSWKYLFPDGHTHSQTW